MALAFEKYGSEEELKKDPIDHLFKLYVRINAEKTAEKEAIEAQQKEGKDVTELEAKCLDEQARGYFKRMVRKLSSNRLSLAVYGILTQCRLMVTRPVLRNGDISET